MDIVTGIIEKVNQREKNYSVAIKGQWYSGFGTCKMKEGELIEISYVKSPDGKFNNIKFSEKIESEPNMYNDYEIQENVIEEKVEAPKKDFQTVKNYNDSKSDEIIKQVCLKCAVEILNTHSRELPTAAGIVMYAQDLFTEFRKMR